VAASRRRGGSGRSGAGAQTLYPAAVSRIARYAEYLGSRVFLVDTVRNIAVCGERLFRRTSPVRKKHTSCRPHAVSGGLDGRRVERDAAEPRSATSVGRASFRPSAPGTAIWCSPSCGLLSLLHPRLRGSRAIFGVWRGLLVDGVRPVVPRSRKEERAGRTYPSSTGKSIG